VSAGAIETVKEFVAVSSKKARAADIDVSRVYTNEFAREH
jgi:hypothetical protein